MIKNRINTLSLYVANTSTASGVTGATSGFFSTIKLLQDGVLSSNIIHTNTLQENGMGYYSISGSAAQLNYGSIQMIATPTGALIQTYSPILYTEDGVLSTGINVSGLTPVALSEIVVSGDAASWSVGGAAVTVSGMTPAALSQVVTSGNAQSWNIFEDTDGVLVSGLATAVVSGIWDINIESVTTAGTAGQKLNNLFKTHMGASQIVASGSEYHLRVYNTLVPSGNPAFYSKLVNLAGGTPVVASNTITGRNRISQ